MTPPCSSAHGILQAKILESVAVSFSRGSSQPRNHSTAIIKMNILDTLWPWSWILLTCSCLALHPSLVSLWCVTLSLTRSCPWPVEQMSECLYLVFLLESLGTLIRFVPWLYITHLAPNRNLVQFSGSKPTGCPLHPASQGPTSYLPPQFTWTPKLGWGKVHSSSEFRPLPQRDPLQGIWRSGDLVSGQTQFSAEAKRWR